MYTWPGCTLDRALGRMLHEHQMNSSELTNVKPARNHRGTHKGSNIACFNDMWLLTHVSRWCVCPCIIKMLSTFVGKTLVHEFAHWRYNLGDEYPRQAARDQNTIHFYQDSESKMQPNRCTKKVNGHYKVKGNHTSAMVMVMSRSRVDTLSELCSPFLKGRQLCIHRSDSEWSFSRTLTSVNQITMAWMAKEKEDGI